jgi:TPR repeat protein|tara:strand:- start:273 stop:890 length:618 start_codon:yes stop_codon:yes gene_type:complete
MKFKYYLTALLFIGLASTSQAENHTLSPKLAKNFEMAVKNVENKNFLAAVKMFNELAENDLPEAQFNLSLLHSSGLGTPKNYKTALYWSWQAHLNGHETAINQVTEIYDLITEALRDTVANQIIDELLAIAKAGDQNAALKLGKTYTDLLVVPDYQSAYVWLSIAQAYGLESASSLLKQTADQLTLEDILLQQEQAANTFSEINS